jgi:RNA recognition motif-containing protein
MVVVGKIILLNLNEIIYFKYFSFVNYAEPDSCTKAVDNMNNFVLDRFTLFVNHSTVNIFVC